MDKTLNIAPDISEIDDLCAECNKIQALCVCADVKPVENRVCVLILQHPQEQDRELGTARLAQLHFRNSALKIGLSWPNLAKAVGRPADPHRWGVLYLGAASGVAGGKPEKPSKADLKSIVAKGPRAPNAQISVLDRHGKPLEGRLADETLGALDGIILLDGSWSQAKTLWWRNPWLLKTCRIVLNPARPSLYGRFRKEPRRESVSTLEAAAMVMARLEGSAEIETHLLASFQQLLQKYRLLKAG